MFGLIVRHLLHVLDTDDKKNKKSKNHETKPSTDFSLNRKPRGLLFYVICGLYMKF